MSSTIALAAACRQTARSTHAPTEHRAPRGCQLLAVDGTRIKAVNTKDRNFTRSALSKFIREADEKPADYMKRLDDGDTEEERVGGNSGGSGRGDGKLAEKIATIRDKRARHKAMLEELDRTGKDQISLTDPETSSCTLSGRGAPVNHMRV